ncbi:hypothetical protein [Pelagimonas phthalicica]|uniref:hypothetical protein n=1 Tax=Pelagimonas phthalicica TaxID=1037362 RepID=UPI00105F8B77|nr:hypothetical protein [Pelagimonas phthalicica]
MSNKLSLSKQPNLDIKALTSDTGKWPGWAEAIVNSNITQALIIIGSESGNTGKSSWQLIKPLFYRLFNADDSLTIQPRKAMFNGLLWTTSADARAISILFTIISVAYHFVLDSQGALEGVFVFAAIAAVT